MLTLGQRMGGRLSKESANKYRPHWKQLRDATFMALLGRGGVYRGVVFSLCLVNGFPLSRGFLFH